jgi:cell division protein FtsB
MAKKILYSKPLIFLLVLIFVLSIIALGRESYRYFGITQEVRDLEKRIEDLEVSNEELSKMEEYFQSDDFLEKEARLKLNLAKPAEKLIIIKQPESLEQEIVEEKKIAKEVSNLQKWWDYFFSIKEL